MRKECALEWVDDNGNVITNYTTKKPNDVIDPKNDAVDLISRADAIETVCEQCEWERKCHETCQHIETLTALPSADRPQGEWTYDNACSLCGCQPWYEHDIHTLNYCPNCGAKMGSETR